MVDEVLARHGHELLKAYEDPDVDFMDSLAQTFGFQKPSQA